MKIKFFSRLSYPNRAQFRTDYVRQNIEAVRSMGIVFFVLDVVFKLSPLILGLQPTQVKNIHEYDVSVTIHLTVTPVFIVLSLIMLRQFKQTPRHLFLGQLLTIVFASYLISAGMVASFFGMHNPKNTVTLYMITLMIAAIFFVFEYYETVLIGVITTVIFSSILPHYVTDSRQLLLNQFMSVVLLIVFFSISRYVFSYRANHFIQLKTIKEKNAQIEIANQVKDEILGIVAHDLRNPLAAIESIATLMQMDDNIDEESEDNILMIKASCERARMIINDLIEVARNDVDNEFEVHKTDLNKFLLQIVEQWMHTGNKPKIAYYGPQKPVFAWINEEKMHRVMDNLISNAVKFSDEDEGIEVSLRDVNNAAFIDVKDFGVGIPDNLLPNIFDRFSKASRTGLHGEESIGLGLSIVKQIITKHGGQVNVKSVETKGTTFTISLTQSLAS
ncbi:sensor histidine kinase [Mucilaginibacter sp. AW1-3]